MDKSNPAFFKQLIVELKGYKIEEMLFIDDSRKNIENAPKNGIKGIVYLNNQQLKEALKTHLR